MPPVLYFSRMPGEHYHQLERAMDLCRNGLYRQAVVLFDSVEDQIPASSTLLFNRAKALAKLNQLDRSLQDLNGLIRLEPDNAVWYSERAILYHILRKPMEALADLDKAVVLDPENPYRYASRAFIKDYYQDHHGAVDDYGKAIELDPDDAISYNNKGLVEEKLGLSDLARESFKKADRLDAANKTNTEKKAKAGSHQPPASPPASPGASIQPLPSMNRSDKMTLSYFIQTVRDLTSNSSERRRFLNFFLGKKQ